MTELIWFKRVVSVTFNSNLLPLSDFVNWRIFHIFIGRTFGMRPHLLRIRMELLWVIFQNIFSSLMDDLSLRQGQNEAMNFSINVSHSPSQNITEKNKLLSFFSQYSSRILNLNLSNGGERNSLKLGFKISAHNGDQLLLCWKLNTEIKRGENVVFMAGITSRQSSG